MYREHLLCLNVNFLTMCFSATIKSTMDACDVVDHNLAKLVASLLEVRRKETMVNKTFLCSIVP